MLMDIRANTEDSKENTIGIDIFRQNYTQLPAKGKLLLKKHLQNLVSLQNIMIETVSTNKTEAS